MNILTPATIPIVFLIISGIFTFNYLRQRGAQDVGQAIAQKNRLRMALIFGAVGVGLVLWRMVGPG